MPDDQTRHFDRARPDLSHLQLAMEGGQLGIWELDPDTLRFKWSDNSPQILGWAPDDLPETLHDLLDRVVEEDRHEPMGRLTELLEGQADVNRAEFRILHRDGGTRWMEARGHLVETPSGHPIATGTFHNISERKQAELELTTSEERLRVALAASRVGTWEFDLQTGRVIWTDETARIFGIDPSEFGGDYESYLHLVHPDDRSTLAAEVARALEGDDSFSVTHRIEHPDLGLRWLRGTAQIQRGATGQALRAVGTVADITTDRETRRALEEQRALLARQARILEQTQAAAQVGGFERDMEAGTAWWTEQMYELRGKNPEHFDPARDDIWDGFPPAAARTLEAATTRVMTQGQFREVVVPMTHPTRGSRWVRVALEPMRSDSGGQITGYYGALTDITRRKREQDLLVRVARAVSTGIGDEFLEAVTRDLAETFEAEEAFVGLLEDDPDADPGDPGDVDPAGRHIGSRRIRTIARHADGGPAEPLLYRVGGTPCLDVVRGRVGIYRTGVSVRFPDDVLLQEFGAESYAGAPIMDSSGEVIGLLGVFSRDPLPFPASASSLLQIFAARTGAELQRMATEKTLAQTEIELYQSQKMEAIGKLAGGIAHDFNNLLTVINSSADMALADLGDAEAPPESVQESLEEIRASGRRAAELTRQLLAFSRKQVMQASDLDPEEVIQAASSLLQRLLGDQIEVVTRFGHGDARIRVDRGQLEQVLVNLAVNARDAMPEGGTLTLETALVDEPDADALDGLAPPDDDSGRWVRLTVTDSGVGIPPEVQAQIFDPFFTTKAPGTGTGLGLSTVYGIVRQSGGFIGVLSETGAGSTFRIDLPRVQLAPSTSSDLAGTATAEDATTVLLVEDDDAVRRATLELLTSQGCNTLSCRDLDEAAQALDTHGGDIHIILADRLSDASGRIDLRTRSEHPIVLLTDFHEGRPREHGRAHPGFDPSGGRRVTVLPRPISGDRLARTLRSLARQPRRPT